MGHNMSETALLLAMHGRPEDPLPTNPQRDRHGENHLSRSAASSWTAVNKG